MRLRSSSVLIPFLSPFRHVTDADTVEQTADEALSDSKKSLALIRTLMNRENKVKEVIGDLKNM